MARAKNPHLERVLNIAELRSPILRSYGPTHPLYLALQGLPDHLSRDQYLAALRALLPLARIREDG